MPVITVTLTSLAITWAGVVDTLVCAGMVFALLHSTDVLHQRRRVIGEVRFQRDWRTMVQGLIVALNPIKTFGVVGVCLFRRGWQGWVQVVIAALSWVLWLSAPVSGSLFWLFDTVSVCALHFGEYEGALAMAVRVCLGVPACLAGFIRNRYILAFFVVRAVCLYEAEVFQVLYGIPSQYLAVEVVSQQPGTWWETVQSLGGYVGCAIANAAPGVNAICNARPLAEIAPPYDTGRRMTLAEVGNLWRNILALINSYRAFARG